MSSVVYTQKERLKKMEVFLESLHNQAGNVTQACKAANIGRCTYYAWMGEYPEFKNAVTNIREELIDYAEGALLTAIKDKNVTAITFFLKTQGKHRGYVE